MTRTMFSGFSVGLKTIIIALTTVPGVYTITACMKLWIMPNVSSVYMVTRISIESLVNRELRCDTGTVLAAVTACQIAISISHCRVGEKAGNLKQKSEDLPLHF